MDFTKLNNETTKMLFIYNAINDGWIVKQLPDKRYQFSKNKGLVKNISLDDFLENFINENLNSSKILLNK